MQNNSFNKTGGDEKNKARAIGFLLANELSEREVQAVAGAGADTTWAMGPGGQAYASDVAK